MIRPELFKVLGSGTRLRILLALAIERDYVSVYRISTETFLNRNVLKKHISILEKAGLVTVERTAINSNGSLSWRCTLNMNNKTVKALTDFFESIELISEAPEFRIIALGRSGHMKTKLGISPTITPELNSQMRVE